MHNKVCRIAVVGPGLIGRRHIALINENPAAELVAIIAPDRPQNSEFAKDQAVRFFDDLSACIATVDLDAVIISSPNEFHAAQARLCIEAGLPTLIEKPITSDIEDARAISALVSESSVPVLVGHHRHYSPLLEVAYDHVVSGRLGRIVSFTGSAQFYKPTQYFLDGPWRTKPGGGPILINLIHEIGVMRSLVGEISEVHAYSSNAVRHFEVEDTVSINLRFECGALGTFILSDCASTPVSWEQTTSENLSYPSYPTIDCYAITGTLGSLHFPTMRIFSYDNEEAASWWLPFTENVDRPTRKDPLERQLEHFIDLVGNGGVPRVSAYDGLQNLIALEAIRLSIVEGRSIALGSIQ